jgi:hypothetical protein
VLGLTRGVTEREKMTTGSKCDRCDEFIADLDAGFSPAMQGMQHGGCGGNWVAAVEEEPISHPDEPEGEERYTFGCDSGHRWEATEAEDIAADHRCPTCGEYWQ